MKAHTSGTMNGASTRKPSSTSPASTTTVMSRRSHGTDTKSSIGRFPWDSAQAGGVGDEHREGEQYADGERERTAKGEIRGRQQRADGPVLVEPEAPRADDQQRKSPLAAQRHGGGRDGRRQQRAADSRRLPRQAPGDRQPPVHRAARGEQHGSPGESDALRELARTVV